jgi:hypothetical protein
VPAKKAMSEKSQEAARVPEWLAKPSDGLPGLVNCYSLAKKVFVGMSQERLVERATKGETALEAELPTENQPCAKRSPAPHQSRFKAF